MNRPSRAGIPALDVRLLGPIEVERDAAPVALGGQKPRALLAVLALDPGRVVSVDRLVEALWPGDPPETAAHAIQVYVSQLRKALGAGVLETRAPGYVLELDPDAIDVHRFSRLAQEGAAALAAGESAAAEVALREALALWRGPALADFLYEPFAQTQIARLEELRTVVVEERIEADLALGRHAELVSELEALVQAERLRERPRAQLMLALYRSGRQADALAAYRDARETLVEELGIEPGPELKELEAAILRQDESLLLEQASLAKPAMQFRRLVTILFVDVVESMALAEALDAEALAGVLRRYFETVSAATTRHGGVVEKYAGDAVMAAFGVPVSHEDDALRAARAAHEIRIGMAALNEQLVRQHGLELEVRIGFEAGEVVATPTAARQRLVTGEAVGIAARLEQAAGPGEILVGEVASRLIDHAAVLESIGELEIKGKREPVRPYRLVELVPIGPAFEARADAPLVGRKRELAELRRALKGAVDESSVRVSIVVGQPGVGKSRLVAELARRARAVTTLWGRCLSYGEGITYWPLRDVLAAAAQSAERDAVVEALDAETPPAAAEIALLFRRFCEAVARERPLLLVLDDLHWAEPTFLELVEHVVDKGDAPIFVLGVAREELLDERTDFLMGRDNVARLVLDALSAAETEALLDGLGGAVLDTDQRERIVSTGEGNPFFLEQLLALALEGGLVERQLPATVQALLAARLDRLGPGERAVLERGSVIGKEFRLDEVVALLDPDAVPTAELHADALVVRGFIRPTTRGAFRFRHVLVQEAVYRAAPKRLRAELHERFIDRFEARPEAVADIDEFAGYHLEQAYRLRTELGEADRRTARLAEDGGHRLGEAGMRAFRRGDNPASQNLLRRALALLSPDDRLGRELRCNLAIALFGAGESRVAADLLETLVSDSEAAEDARQSAWARMELEYIRTRRGETGDELLRVATEAIPVFERSGGGRPLARAWLFMGWLHGGHRGDHTAWLDAAERALALYREIAWSTSTCIGEIGSALYWGPTHVSDAIERCEELLRDEATDRIGAANAQTFIGGLAAQRGEFDRARELARAARATLEDLGHFGTAQNYSATVMGEIELLDGEADAAAAIFRGLCDELVRMESFSHLASRASDLAEALLLQGHLDAAEEWTRVAEKHAAADDLNAQMMWRPVRARVLARRGEFAGATKLARQGVRMSDATDDLNRRAEAYRDLGEVQQLAGRSSDALTAFSRAAELFAAKGNVVGASRIRSLQQDLALV